MRTILIYQNTVRTSDYQVLVDGGILDGLCWDEMLEVVARTILCPNSVNYYRPKASPINRDEWIEVAQVDGFFWTIMHRGRFISYLTNGEALAFVAAYTFCGKQMFSGFQTYEQYARVPWRLPRSQPVALLN